MSYQMSTITIRSRPSGRTAAVLAGVAAALYVLAYYTPLISGFGNTRSMSDGDSVLMWLWIVPGVGAMVASGLGLAGKALGTAIAVGLDVGMAGFTAFEMIMVHRATDVSGGDAFGVSIEKGFGFWCFCIAAVLSVAASLALMAGRTVDEARCSTVLSVLAGFALMGVTLSILLPEHGRSVLDIDDGLVQFGIITWAVLAPLFALLMSFSHTRSAVAFVLGVGLSHAGLSIAMLQDLSKNGTTNSLTTGHSAVFHWSVAASVVFAVLAMGRVVQAVAPAAPFAPYAPGPVGAPTPYQPPAPPQVQPVSQPVAQPVAQSVAQSPSQWVPDPYGRHQYRYWDGNAWTPSVSDNGVVGHDPI